MELFWGIQNKQIYIYHSVTVGWCVRVLQLSINRHNGQFDYDPEHETRSSVEGPAGENGNTGQTNATIASVVSLDVNKVP